MVKCDFLQQGHNSRLLGKERTTRAEKKLKANGSHIGLQKMEMGSGALATNALCIGFLHNLILNLTLTDASPLIIIIFLSKYMSVNYLSF
jgi:hypothetical protein